MKSPMTSLYEKCFKVGIDRKLLSLIQCTNKKQCARIELHLSTLELTYWIPQGSILRPLLFLFINDWPEAVIDIISSGNQLREFLTNQQTLRETTNIGNWLRRDKMQPNVRLLLNIEGDMKGTLLTKIVPSAKSQRDLWLIVSNKLIDLKLFKKNSRKALITVLQMKSSLTIQLHSYKIECLYCVLWRILQCMLLKHARQVEPTWNNLIDYQHLQPNGPWSHKRAIKKD